MPHISRRLALGGAGGILGAAVMGLTGCSPNHSESAAVPTASAAGPPLGVTGDPAVLGESRIYTTTYPFLGQPAKAVILSPDGTVLHSVTSDVELSNLSPWTIGGSRFCSYFREVQDGSVNPKSFRRGEFVITDGDLTELWTARLIPTTKRPGPSVLAEMHEFILLGDRHYIAQDYVKTALGGKPVWSPYIQEVKAGKVVFEWLGAEHSVLGTFKPQTAVPVVAGATDSWHANSLQVLADGSFLMSMRNASTIVKIDRSTGEVLWALGGSANQFAGAPQFSLQHDARLHNGTLTLFDNGTTVSRGVVVDIDETNRTCKNLRTFTVPGHHSAYCGGTQVLADGYVAVGWGMTRNHADLLTVFTADGKPAYSLSTPLPDVNTYRVVIA